MYEVNQPDYKYYIVLCSCLDYVHIFLCQRNKAPQKITFSILRLSVSRKASVTIMADFSPEFDPPVRWRSKHQTKNDC